MRSPGTLTMITLFHMVVNNDMSQARAEDSLQLVIGSVPQRPRHELHTAEIWKLWYAFALHQTGEAFALIVCVGLGRVAKVVHESCIELDSVWSLEALFRHEPEAQGISRRTEPEATDAFLEPRVVDLHQAQ